MVKHILVPMDGSPLAECVLPHVIAIARPFGAKVTLLHVCERQVRGVERLPVNALNWHMQTAEADAYLDEMAGRLQRAGSDVELARVGGKAAEQIITFADQHAVDLIVLSSHGRSGLSGWNVSGVVWKTIDRAGVSIMIVRAYQPVIGGLTDLSYSRLLLPLDCSQRADQTLPLATVLARFHGAQLVLAHIVPKPEMPRSRPLNEEEVELISRITDMNRTEANRHLDEIRSSLLPQQADVETLLLVSDNLADSLHELVRSQEIDLVLMSAHGFSGSTKWPYGSLALNFIIYGTRPLLIVQDLSPDQMEPTQAEIVAKESRGH